MTEQTDKFRLSDNPGEVQDFYERYPYPPPVESLEKYRMRWQDKGRLHADHFLFYPDDPFADTRSILVAGCGTSQAAKYAIRWPKARVTGIDFSAKSIESTRALKKRYQLENLELVQLPVERAEELGRKFDHIVCTGVLHHLPDPDKGLKALHDVLEPKGAMHLMVYASYGRTGIYMLQDFCKRLGVVASDEGIRDLIEALKSLPPGHPLGILLQEVPDFRNEAALADALLHPQDRAFTVPEFFDFVENAGMKFGRWIKQAPYSPHCGAIAGIPQASRIESLEAKKQFAVVELFRGTMVRHSAVIHRNDRPDGLPGISFNGEEWRGFVPVRMADTICVEERLPPNAAGVLINRTHTYRDLIFPINSSQKQLFDAIDGVSSIDDIIGRSSMIAEGESDIESARNLFEHLWLYDQVVFDLSGASPV